MIRSDLPEINAQNLCRDARGHGGERTKGAVNFSGPRTRALTRTHTTGSRETDQQHQHQHQPDARGAHDEREIVCSSITETQSHILHTENNIYGIKYDPAG